MLNFSIILAIGCLTGLMSAGDVRAEPLVLIQVDPDGGPLLLYWTDSGTDKIQRTNPDSSGVEDLVTGLRNPLGLALDASAGKLYWSDYGTDKIQRSNLNGTEVGDLVTSGLRSPLGLALDGVAGKLYWADYGTDKIQRSNLDGSEVEDVIATGLRVPRGLALDASAGKLYWSDSGTDKIQRSNLDGSATGDGAYQKPEAIGAPRAGAVYVVAGTAGSARWGPLNHPAMAVSINKTLGSMVLDVDGSRLDAIFLDSTGNIRDDFTILKVPDTTSPQIWSVQAQGTPTQAVVTFSEYVEQASAETASNYAIDNGVTVSTAGLGGGGRTVTLTTAPLTQGITYTLTVNNVVDLTGNPIATDSQEQFQHNIITDSFQDGVAPTAGYGEP